MAKAAADGKELSYGDASARLEQILGRIEEGQVDIDELSGLVREAAELVTLCRGKIHAAEIQVKTITEQLERELPGAIEVDDEDDAGDGGSGAGAGGGPA
jgi:exodeoxyribonuclease VII small subunit